MAHFHKAEPYHQKNNSKTPCKITKWWKTKSWKRLEKSHPTFIFEVKKRYLKKLRRLVVNVSSLRFYLENFFLYVFQSCFLSFFPKREKWT